MGELKVFQWGASVVKSGLSNLRVSLKRRNAFFALFILFAFCMNSIIIPMPVLAAEDDFLITKSVDKTEVYPGEVFSYTISYSNLLTDAPAAVLTDVLPPNIVYVSSEGSVHVSSIEKTGTPGVDETVIFRFNDPLPAGSTGTLKINAKFPEGTTIGGAANAAINTASIVSPEKSIQTSNQTIVTPLVKAPDWTITKAKIIPTVTPAVGQPVTYLITVHGNSGIGGVNMNGLVITDAIPANAEYVSSSDSGAYDDQTGLVTFPTVPVLKVGETVTRRITLIYNEVTTADTAINTATATATPLGDPTPVVIQASTQHGFADPIFSAGNFSKTARQENDQYSVGQSAVFYLNNVSNTGNIPMDNFVVEDSIPDGLILKKVSSGSYNMPAAVKISYQTNLDSVYREWAPTLVNPENTAVLVSDLGLDPALEWVTKVRWEISGAEELNDIAPGFALQRPLTLYATVTDFSPSYTNNASMTANQGSNTINRTDAKTIYVAGQMPWLVPEKSVRTAGMSTYTSTASVSMRGTLEFRLRIKNHEFATGNYINPVAVDVIPPELENILFTGYEASSGVDVSSVSAPQITGNKLMSVFSGITLTPGEYVDIFYTARVKDQTTAGLYENQLYISTLENNTIYQNNTSASDDLLDLDSDGSTSDRFLNTKASFFVRFSGALNSQKLMIGSLDSAWGTVGSTLPGGLSNYQITIANTGSNGPISNIVAIDQLPSIGDKTVLSKVVRSSEWRPYLVNEVSYHIYNAANVEIFPAGATISIYYSTKGEVSTAELYDPVNGTPDPSWTTTPPADITTVKSVKFVFSGFELQKDQKVVVEWPMRAPYDAPADVTAYNSFAYGATYPNYIDDVLVKTPFLPSEPQKVMFHVQNPAGYTYNLGNFVWEDSNKNGIQDPGENGINGVLVNLYDSNDVLVSFTRTGDSQGSLPGYYLFPKIPAGNYYLEFVYPQNYQITNYQAGSDPAADSDIISSTRSIVSDLGVNKYAILTDIFTLSADNMQMDAGLYEYASIGNYVWNDRNADSRQTSGEPGITGVLVELLDADGNPVLNSSNNPVTAITDAAGYYSFTNVDPGIYKVRFTNPSGNYKICTPNASGSTADNDSNGIPDTGELTATTAVFTLTTGQVNTSIDQGMYLANVGNFVFADTNANGIQDDGGARFAGVTLRLYTSSGDLVRTSTATTSANSNYLFIDLVPGDYYVEATKTNTSAKFTKQDIGLDAADSDVIHYIDRNVQVSRTSDFTLARGERNLTIDIGLYVLSGIGDKVWNDINGNGIQDNAVAEPGLANITVHLFKADGTTPATYENGDLVPDSVTNASGIYSFTGLEPGTYIVKFDLPAQYIFSPKNASGSTGINDSNADTATGLTSAITLTSGQTNTTWDAGIHKAMLGNFVWDDKNANGIQDVSEPGIPGVTVTLYDSDDNVITNKTTDSSGYYSFTELNGGTYYLNFTQPGIEWFASPKNAVLSTTSNDSNIFASGLTENVIMNTGDINLTMDAGYYKKASVGDRIWNDVDADGIQDAGESGISGVKVSLTGPDTSIEVITDENGNYLFSNLIPAAYTVSIDTATLPLNYQQSYEQDGSKNGSTSVTLVSGDVVTNVDFGYYVKSSIGDRVWQDLDADGIQDLGEHGIAGITVTLYDSTGETGSTTTDASGNYLFSSLLVGTYTVGITVPGTWFISPYHIGADGAVNSDIQIATARSASILLLGGQDIRDIDAGLYQKASIGDRIWSDVNGDGIQDLDESGLAGVKLTLTGPGVSIETTTDTSGNYSFANLVPGEYTVTINSATLPADYHQTYELDTTLDGSVVITINSDDQITTVDFGYYVKASIGDTVWQDTNANGLQDAGEPGISGVTVTLYDSDGNAAGSTTTDSDGYYLFEDLLVGTYTVEVTVPENWFISPEGAGGDAAADSDIDTVTAISSEIDLPGGRNNLDIDAGLYQKASVGDRVWNDINGDGIQDVGEPGIQGVTVTLTGSDITLQATTDADGNYSFAELVPGEYTIEIDPDTLPLDVQQSYDPDTVTDGAHSLTLVSNDQISTVDFGYYVKPSIGDTVWQDTNANGIQDSGEPGISGVIVTLYDSDGNTAGSTSTDSDGYYLFEDLLVGTYTVEVTVLDTWFVSPKGAGSDTDADSDIDTVSAMSSEISLLGGQNIRDIDAGLYQKASIGDLVWFDLNGNGMQDEVNTGAENVIINLLDQAGNVIDSTNTDITGYYLFTDLVPGQYQIQIVLPSGYSFAVMNAADSDDNNDSDMDYITGNSPLITVVSGEMNSSVDAGLTYAAISIDKELVTSVYDPELPLFDEDSGMQGTPVTYVFRVTNTGTTYLKDITITDNELGIDRSDMILISGTEPLAPGAAMRFYYTTTIDGDLTNTVDVTGTPCGPDGAALNEIPDPTDDDQAKVNALASVGDYIWEDLNANGIQDPGEPGIPNVKVILTCSDQSTLEVLTDEYGRYLFDNLVPGNYSVSIAPASLPADIRASYEQDGTLDGLVQVILESGSIITYIDFGYYIPASAGDRIWNDTDGDGMQDDNEPGIPGVKVTLTLPDLTVLETVTDSSGIYLFKKLIPGDYIISVDPTTLPDDIRQSYELDGTKNGSTAITLISDSNIRDVDFGYFILASVGDFVWGDKNRDGLQQSNEPGFAGVTVRLYDKNDKLIATTKTDSLGKYVFTNVVPGSYYVKFEPLQGFKFTLASVGSDRAKDSNATQAGTTPLFTVYSGSNIASVDAGLYCVTDVSGTVVDNNGKPIAGADVVIKDENGNVLGTTVTDADGNYIIREVPGCGVITITISKTGHITKVISVDIKEKGGSAGTTVMGVYVAKTGETSVSTIFAASLLIAAGVLILMGIRRKSEEETDSAYK